LAEIDFATGWNAPPRRVTDPVLTIHLANGILIAMTLTLDKLGRLVVPKPLRDRFGLAPGDELAVRLEPDGFRLQLVRSVSPVVKQEGLLVCTSEIPSSAWDTGAFVEKERERRIRQIGGI
jgi:AbrB family looped-hinge helix DNA binding protein